MKGSVMSPEDPTVRSVAGRVAERWAEIYLGDIPSIQLPVAARILCAFTGTFILTSIAYFSKNVSGLNFVQLLWNDASNQPAMAILAAIMTGSSPIVLAVMTGLSFKKGGPLRFFMLGFFFYSLIMSVAILQFPDIDSAIKALTIPEIPSN